MTEQQKYPPCPFCGGKLRKCKMVNEYSCKQCNKYVKEEELE